MKVNLTFASEDDKLLDSHLEFDLPSVPQPGDTISILRPEQSGCASLKVLSVHWNLDHATEKPLHQVAEHVVGSLNSVTLECEFSVGSYDSEEHRSFIIDLTK